MASPRILIVEPTQLAAAELAGIANDLTSDGITCERAVDLGEAIRRLSGDSPPELVVLPESRPGIWTDRELAALRAAAPLVRVIRVSGSWCDGQNRSGRPPAGSTGMAWHQIQARLQRELTEGEGDALAAPLTSTTEDAFLANLRPGPARTRSELIAVHAPRTSAAEAWATMCRGLGHRATIVGGSSHDGATAEDGIGNANGDRTSANRAYGQNALANRAPEQADAVLWDCEPRTLADEAAVRAFVRRASAPVIAICGFPRPDDVQSAERQGVLAVLAKPLLVADLEWHLSRLFGATAER